MLQGDTALARQRLDESLNVRTKLGEKLTAADSRSAAGARGARRGPHRGRRTAGPGRRRHLRAPGRAGWSCDGAGALARAMLAAGRGDAALAEAKRAQALVGQSQNDRRQTGDVDYGGPSPGPVAPQNAAQAVAELERAHAQATALGLVPLRFEASLALAEVAAARTGPAADARFAALEKEARSRGFGLVAIASRCGASDQAEVACCFRMEWTPPA